MAATRVLRIVSRLSTGGPVRHVIALTEALGGTRYEQWLAAGPPGCGERSMRPALEARGIAAVDLPGMTGTTRFGPGDAEALVRVRRLIRHVRPDIVETHTSKAGVVGRLAACLEHVPVVLHVYHGHVLTGYFGAIKTVAARLAERALARASDQLIAVSPRVKRDLVQYRIAPPNRIHVVEPGIDLSPFLACRPHRGGLRRELGVDPHVPLIGFIGRLAPVKNPRLFVTTARTVLIARPDAHFVVVGDGELGADTRALAHRMGIAGRMTFLGWRDDVARVCADLDALVLCSHREGAPLAIVEAMAAGCPVVATRVGGVPDLIEDQVSGLLAPPGEREPLAAAVLRIIADRAFAYGIAQRAQARATARWSAARLAGDMDAVYVALLSAHAAGARRSVTRHAHRERARDAPRMAHEPHAGE